MYRLVFLNVDEMFIGRAELNHIKKEKLLYHNNISSMGVEYKLCDGAALKFLLRERLW